VKLCLHLVKKYWIFLLIGLTFTLQSIIPIRLAIAYLIAPQPEVIFTLGGGQDREEFTAKFAQKHPTLDIWISSGMRPELARPIFKAAGIPESRLHLDTRAVDTVTNFTSVVKDFKNRRIHHLYLITSNFHMRRARAIAKIVLGSQGITFTSVYIPSKKPKESIFRVIRDSGRSFMWILTGRTGASLNPKLPHPHQVLKRKSA
jgi:uncharacterized SAM-binding protein YcdF (DUF218 family)